MKRLFQAWGEVVEPLRTAERLLLLFDFDGTLSPIVERPDRAVLPASRRKLLLDLKEHPRMVLGIVSGRALKDVMDKVGLQGIYYAGNHGLEIVGPNLEFHHPDAEAARPTLEAVQKRLQSELSGIAGVLLEDKGLGLSFHLRRIPVALRSEAKERFFQVVQPFLEEGRIRVGRGKAVLEVKPAVPWDKGAAVTLILEAVGGEGPMPLPVYLGDDEGDEAAFQALGKEGLSIWVGEPRAGISARYFVRDPREVEGFLLRLLRIEGNTDGEAR